MSWPRSRRHPQNRSDDERAGDQDDHAIGREGEFGRKEGDSPTSFSRWEKAGEVDLIVVTKAEGTGAHGTQDGLDDPQTQASGTSPHPSSVDR